MDMDTTVATAEQAATVSTVVTTTISMDTTTTATTVEQAPVHAMGLGTTTATRAAKWKKMANKQTNEV